MHCPKCAYEETKVVDSRPSKQNIRRRRECLKCNYRFSTLEEVKILDLQVEKRSGQIENFSQQKLEVGIRKAFNKRQIDKVKIDILVQKVTEDLLALDKKQVKSTKIGKLVLKQLKNTDEVAYICFAAMFGNFGSLEAFNKILRDLQEGSKE